MAKPPFTQDMDILQPTDPDKFLNWLFDRLGDIPDVVWDRNVEAVHTSYDDWNVWGTQTIAPVSPPASSSRHSSPPVNGRPPFNRHGSGDSRSRGEEIPTRRVIARISRKPLRLDRQFQVKKYMATLDPKGDYHVRALQLLRLPPGDRKNEPSLTVLLLESPTQANSLRGLVNYGPAWYLSSQLPANYPFDPRITSDGKRKTGQVPLTTFLRFAIAATECCELVHQQAGVHGEIRPDAFYFSEETGRVRWVNHGAGIRAFENGLTTVGWAALSNEYGVEYRLQYISPEQTGRLEIKPDSRTDIYSLGIVFWTMLVGDAPFQGKTAIEIMQNVLSRRLPSATSKRTDVPDALSAVIQKMVQKNIEHRYHSVLGLKYDLQQIDNFLREGETEALRNFQVGHGDQNCVFRLANVHIGRDRERDAILEVMSNVSQKQKRFWQTIGIRPADSDTASRGHQSYTPRLAEAVSDSASVRSNPSSASSVIRNEGSNESSGSNNKLRRESTVSDADPSMRSSVSRTFSNDAIEDTVSTSDTGLRPISTHSGRISNQALKRTRKFKRDGKTEILALSGDEGVGKSSLIQSIQPTARSRGYWASSKFDTMKAPKEAMIQVMSSLFRQIFMESDGSGDFHADLKNMVKPLWPVLHQMLGLPFGLLDFDGSKMPVSEPSSNEPNSGATATGANGVHHISKNSEFLRTGATAKRSRFKSMFLDILRYLALRKLIVFFLDDLQAADDESLEMLQDIVNSGVGIALFVTFRDANDLSPRAQALLNSSAANVKRLNLSPLTEQDISELLVTTLSRTPDYLFGLVAVTLEKTQGNPFYVREFLDSCYKKNLIHYSWTDRLWKYDLDEILQAYDANNDFILARLQDLPPLSRTLLGWASLVGNPFQFPLVKSLMNEGTKHDSSIESGISLPSSRRKADLVRKSSQDAVKALESALKAWIIMPTDEADTFQFCHARYQHAVRCLPEYSSKAPEMHFKVLQMLMQTSKAEGGIFAKCAHLLASEDVIKSRQKMRKPYRDILSSAASQSMESGGRSSGLQYLTSAIKLLQNDPWDEQKPDCFYQETLTLYIRTAECYWTQGFTEDAQKLLRETLQNAKTEFDKVPSYILKSRIATKEGDHISTYEILKRALEGLDLPIPEMSWQACDNRFHELRSEIEELSAEEIVARPLNDDTTLSATTELLAEILSAAFWTDSLRYYQIALVFLGLTLNRGITSHAALAFVSFAACSIARHDLIALGCKAGKVASKFFEMCEYDNYTIGRGQGLQCMLTGWFETNVKSLVPMVDDALEKSMAADDMNFALANAGFAAAMRLWASYDASDVETFCLYGPEELNDWQHDPRGGLMLTAIRQFCRAMQGKTFTGSPNTVLSDAYHDTESYIDWVATHSSSPKRARGAFLNFILPALYLYGYHQDAIVIGEDLLSIESQAWSIRAVLSNALYLSLSYMAALRDGLVADKEEKVEFVEQQHKKLLKWSEINDVNIVAWSLIMSAELNDFKGETREALRSYESALDHAEVHNFTFEHGLASELYAEFLIRRGANRLARYSLKDSIAAYRRISYFGKARQIAEKHEWLLTGTGSLTTLDVGCQTIAAAEHQSSPEPTMDLANDFVEAASTAPAHAADQHSPEAILKAAAVTGEQPRLEALGLDMIDVTGILQSSQVLSSELKLDRLLSKMTNIILESTGAELSAIIVEDPEIGWAVGAISNNFGHEFPTGESLDIVEDVVGKKITLYCLRFQETVFLHNVLEDERFSDVPESYRTRNPEGKSVCAMPILHRDHIAGCVYMEGPPHSFTQRNVAVLRLLLSSVSISITNANLFKQVERVSANNLTMVQSQKQALAQARDAEKKAKRAQREALENLRLKEEAAKAKSMFLANTSHELRTPLNGVIGSSSLLKGSQLTAEQAEWVESIHVCADTLLQVINDILDFSKLEAGKMQMFSIPLSLSETMAEVVRALSYGNMGKDVETVMELDFDESLVVIGDPVRLHQILMNLLSNSYKFTPKGKVTLKAIVESETEKDITVTCSVVDTGIGIDDSQKQKLFTPFSQADNTTSRSYGGTGLGLSICKSIIENAMGGKIWLESQLNVGTTVFFTVTFQKVPKGTSRSSGSGTPVGADPMAVFTPPESGEKILQRLPDLRAIPREELKICIAEDNPINQKIAISYVRKLGFQCEAFPDGAKAVEALSAAAAAGNPFSVVLMDCQMPVLDGYNATRQIRLHPDANVRDVVIIAMTASAIRGDREKCLEAGMNNYLAKPVRQESLKQMLDSYLKHAPTSDPQKQPGNAESDG